MTADRRTWSVRYDGRPWTHNAEHRLHFAVIGSLRKEWRQAFGWLAVAQKIPQLERVGIVVDVAVATGVLGDTTAYVAALKPAMDGLVDAKVIPDDSGAHVAYVLLRPPTRGPDAMRLTILELAEGEDR